MISSEDIVACICEGNTEKYIINLLLESNSLIFSKSQLIDGDVLEGKYRKANVFADQYLTMSYGAHKIVILSIQDNYTVYRINKPYMDKVKSLYLVVTAPEIEMLMIHSMGWYDEFQKNKSKKKPSEYVAEKFKMKVSKVKSKDFIISFFKNHSLEEAIMEHKKKAKIKKGSIFLADLLR